MPKITRIPMKGNRIEWNPELFQTLKEMSKEYTWAQIAVKMQFRYGGRILKERFYAYSRHEKERENARLVKQLAEMKKLPEKPPGFWKTLRFCLFGK